MRKLLVVFFVLAGVITLSQEAHCLGMSHSNFGLSHTATNASTKHLSYDPASADEDHNCHHDHGPSTHASLTFLHSTTQIPSAPCFTATSSQAVTISGLSHLAFASATIAERPPRDRRDGPSDILAITGRLLI